MINLRSFGRTSRRRAMPTPHFALHSAGDGIMLVGMSATSAAKKSVAAPALSRMQLFSIEGYYALRQVLPVDEIGAEEILNWMRAERPGMRRPSGATVLLALSTAKLPRRGRGRPHGGRARHSRVGSPFLPKARPAR